MPSLFAGNYLLLGLFSMTLKITNYKLELRNQTLLCGEDTLLLIKHVTI